MIPIIFSKSEKYSELKKDKSNGLGKIPECLKCVAIEELNGIYILKLKLPIKAKHFKDIEIGGYLKIKPNETSNEQLFRINRISKPLNGIVSIEANHISYDLNKTSVLPFNEIAGAVNATQKLVDRLCRNKEDWEFVTTSTNSTSKFKLDTPCSFRKCLGGKKGSFLDVFGGEFEFDNFTVKHKLHRGVAKGFTIEYGKNLTDIKQDMNIDRTYSHVLPFAKKDDKSPTVLGSILVLQKSDEYKILNLDVSNKFQDGETITKDKIDKFGWDYVNRYKPQNPKVNITVSFVNLADTEEYKDIVQLERVGLGDAVSVVFKELDVVSTAKVVKYEYDCLNERYNKIEIGDIKSKLSTTIKDSINEATADVDRKVNSVQNAIEDQKKIIEDQTNMITGGQGGYIVHTFNANNKPEEILILDKPKIADAVNVIRLNKNGIGFSNKGIDGPYESAWTIDGKFNANFISAGILKGILIEAVKIVGAELKFGNDPNSITLKSNPYNTGAVIEGKGSVLTKSVGMQTQINQTPKNQTATEVCMWNTPETHSYRVQNMNGSAISNRLTMQKNETFNGFWLKNNDKAARLANGFTMLAKSNSNSTIIENMDPNSFGAATKQSISSDSISNMFSIENKKGGTTINDFKMYAHKKKVMNNITISNKSKTYDKKDANAFWLATEEDDTHNLTNRMTMLNTCIRGGGANSNSITLRSNGSNERINILNSDRNKILLDGGENLNPPKTTIINDNKNSIEMTGGKNAGVKIKNADWSSKVINDLEFRQDAVNAIDMRNRDKNGGMANHIAMFNQDRWNSFRFDNNDFQNKPANQLYMESSSGNNSISLKNFQQGQNNVINGEINIKDSITYACQNWHNFVFKGDDPQFRVGGYKGMTTDVTIKNWNGKNIKLVFKYGILVGWYNA